jgi:Icc-related predicted phosphoesterase
LCSVLASGSPAARMPDGASEVTSRTRIYFATDVHGSQRCWLKFVNSAAFYEADLLIMGGDFTGKMIVPVVKTDRNKYRVTLSGKERDVREGDVAAIEQQIADRGFYPYRTEPDEMADLHDSPERVEALFLRLMEDRIRRWLTIALERLAPRGVRCFFGAGNDDPLAIDSILDEYAHDSDGCLVHCNERVVQLTEQHQMITVGKSNHTPWDTPRETTEEDLTATIDTLVAGVSELSSCVFNLHVPPIRSHLDDAPELDADFRPVTRGGQISMAPVGSAAVRRSIERYQPLLGLHGHIHESKGFVKLGRTVCINPGSEYGDGVLDGAIINLDGCDVTYSLVSG